MALVEEKALTEQQVAERAQTLAAKEIELRGEEDAKRAANRVVNERIKGIKAAIGELSDQVHTRVQKIMVEQQPGLFDGDADDDGPPPDDEDEPEGDDEPDSIPDGEYDEVVPEARPWAAGDPEPPPGTEITDPEGVAGPDEPRRPKGRRR
jgi:hypothetical protein